MSPTISVSPQGAIDAGCAASVVYPAWQHTANRSGDTSAGLGASAWAKGYGVSVTEKGGWRLQSVEITSRFTATNKSGAQETSTATETFSDEYDDPLPNPWTRTDPWKNTPQHDLDTYVERLGGADDNPPSLETTGIESEYIYSGPATSPYNYVHTSREVVSIVAHFQYYQPQTRTITAVADPTQGGTVSGGGRYLDGTTVTLNATANAGWQFDSWTSPGEEPVTTSSMSFVVSKNVTWTAHFTEAPKSHIKFIVRTPNGYTGTHPFDWGPRYYIDENGWIINGVKYPRSEKTIEMDVPIGQAMDVIVSTWSPNDSEGACALCANIAFLDYGTVGERILTAVDRLIDHGNNPYNYHFSFETKALTHEFELWFTPKVKFELTSNIGVFYAVDAKSYEFERQDYAEATYSYFEFNPLRAPDDLPSAYEGMTGTGFIVTQNDVWGNFYWYLDPQPPPVTCDIYPTVIAVPTRTKNQSNRIRMTVRRNGYNLISQGTYPSVDKSAWTFSHWDIAIPNADGTVRHERVTDLTLDWWVPMFGLEFAEPVTLRIQAVYKRPGSILYTPTSGRILHGRSGTILYLD